MARQKIIVDSRIVRKADASSSSNDAGPQYAVKAGSAALSSIAILATKVACKPLNVLVSILTANLLGPADKGIVAWVVVLVSVGSYLYGLGCGSAIRFLVASSKKNLTDVGWTVVSLGIINGVLGGLSTLALFEYNLLGSIGGLISYETKWFIVGAMPVFVTETMLSRALIGESRYRFTNLVELTSGIFYPLLLSLFVLVLHQGVFGANLAFFASRIGCAIAVVVYVFRSYKPVFIFDRKLFVDAYSYGLRIWIGGLAIFLNMYIDTLFVGWFMAPSSLGNYSLASTIAKTLTVVSQAVNLVLTNTMIGSRANDAAERTAKIHRLLFVSVMLLAVVLAIAGGIAIPLLMPEFKMTPLLSSILLIGTIASTSYTVLNCYFLSQGLPGRSSISQIAGLALALLVTPIAVYRWDAIGGALASSATNVFIAILMLWFFLRRCSLRLRDVFIPSIQDWGWTVRQVKLATARLRESRNG